MKTTFPNIMTQRLHLREIVDSDLENIFKGLSDPEVIRHYGISYTSLNATTEQLSWYAQKEQLWWAICSAADRRFYGAGGLNDIDTKAGKAEIGLWLLPEFWGKGIMHEALPLIANYGLDQLGLNRIEGFVETENISCKRAMAKLDFQLEKTLPEFEIKAGKLIDVDVYVKTKLRA